MATLTRIYLVTIGSTDRLVRAASPAAALMHVARDLAEVRVATQDDIVDCITDGVTVETLTTEPVQPSAPAPAPAEPKPTDGGAPLFEEIFTEPTPEPEPEADTPADLLAQAQVASYRAATGAQARYRNASTGETWSGRGLKPRWLAEALQAGRPMAEFEVLA